jgi:hypothetical protein
MTLNKYEEQIKVILFTNGVEASILTPLSDLFMRLLESSESDTKDEMLKDPIGCEEYEDFLDSWQHGHGRYKNFFRKKDDDVYLTKEGRRLMSSVIDGTEYKEAFSNADF